MPRSSAAVGCAVATFDFRSPAHTPFSGEITKILTHHFNYMNKCHRKDGSLILTPEG